MARLAGIQVEKDTKGRPAYIRINLRKHGKEIEPFLQKIGVIEQDQDWEQGITGDELLARLRPRIKKLFDK